MLVNALKVLLGHIIILCIFYPWRLAEKITGRDLGGATKSHYYIMNVFRAMCDSYRVSIGYRNTIAKKTSLSLKMDLDLCQNNQQWFFRLKGSYEQEWLRLIAGGLENADMFLDIGSNIGVYALTMGQAFPGKKIIAVEPFQANYALLESNVALNALSNVTTINSAVSNTKDSNITFYPNPIHDGGGSIIQSPSYRTGGVVVGADEYRSKNRHFIGEIEVDNIRIDDLAVSKGVIKIDVEGAEVSAIESGAASFKKGLIDMIVVEVIDETIDEVISLLDSLGFDSFSTGHNDPIKIGERLDHFVGNIVCLRKDSPDYDRYRGML
jgi:FkbM family methyltransferase